MELRETFELKVEFMIRSVRGWVQGQRILVFPLFHWVF